MKTGNHKRRFIFLLAAVILLGSGMAHSKRRSLFRKPGERKLAQMISQAEDARANGQDEQALSILRGAVRQSPNSDLQLKVHLLTGEVYFDMGNCPAALKEFDWVIDQGATNEQAHEAAWGMSLCYYSMGRYQDVFKTLPPLYSRTRSPTRKDSIGMFLGECALRDTDYIEALTWYQAVANDSRDREMRERARALSLKIIDTKLSENQMRTFANESPDKFPKEYVLLRLAELDYQSGNLDRSSDILEHLIRKFPRSELIKRAREIMDLSQRRGKIDQRRIGVLLPLSGNGADIGEKALRGIMLAANVLNPHAPDAFPIELVIRDTKGDPKVVEQALRELVLDEGVIAVIGPMFRRTSLAAATQAQALGVPIITMSQEESITMFGDMVFRNCLTKSAQINALLDFAMEEKGLRSFAILHPDDHYGNEFMNLFWEEAERRGATMTTAEGYALDQTDFAQQIKALAGAYRRSDVADSSKVFGTRVNFEAVFIPDSWNMVAMIAPQLRYHRIVGVQLLGTNAWHSEQLIQATQRKDIEAAVFVDAFAPEKNNPRFLAFDYEFRSTFESAPGLIEAQAYEVVQVLTHCIRDLGVVNRQQLKISLYQIERFPALLGPLNISHDGEWKKPLHLLTFKDGYLLPVGAEIPSVNTMAGSTLSR